MPGEDIYKNPEPKMTIKQNSRFAFVDELDAQINKKGSKMRILDIHSSALAYADFDVDTSTLRVRYHNSSEFYTSWNVPESVVNKFENADSQNGYYSRHIKKQYAVR